MKSFSLRVMLSSMLLLLMLPNVQALAQTSTNAPISMQTWPKTMQVDSHELTFYQPQIQSFNKNQLLFQMALSVTTKGSKTEHYGSMTAKCRLDIEKSQDLAICNKVDIQRFEFPNADKTQVSWLASLKQTIADKSFDMPLSSITANLKVTDLSKAKHSPAFKFTPPKIYVTFKPTALITIDGKPQLRPLEGTQLMHVINTPFIIVLDSKTGWYYLQAGQQWMQAQAIEGPWIKSASLPAEVKKIEKQKSGKPSSPSSKPIQAVVVSSQAASLIQIDGKAEFSPIQGTSLLYVSNTKDNVFLQIKSQQYFSLISGRWYKSSTLTGSSKWAYVDPKNIPATFSHIPGNSAKSEVLSSVPGSNAAKEAVIKNQIPQTAVVKRSDAKLSVHYDGKPRFVKIPNTKVYYASNADKAVFKIGQGFYANYQGIWFAAGQALGPWVAASKVPDAIYTIPPSSPHYNVTYSYIYGATPEYVYVGYTPGYTGSYVYQNTVIYGTGYTYVGWTGAVYYGYPVTWGFNFYYQPYGGWYPVAPYAGPMWFGAGVAVGVMTANHWNHGWFGPNRYYGYRGGNKVNININHNTNVYNHWSKNTVVHKNNSNNNLFNNHKTVNRNHVGSRNSESVRHSQTTVHHSQTTVRHSQTTVKKKSRNNVYSGRDGNVYRDHQGRWQQSTSRGWENKRGNNQVEHLNRQRDYRSSSNRQVERQGRRRR